MSQQAALRRAYDAQAATYGSVRNKRFDGFRDRMMDRFAELVRPIGPRVLDLGSGPGHESLLLRQRGLEPLAVDFSIGMATHCAGRGVPAIVMDYHTLGIVPGSFHGGWMSFSLLHVPKAEATGVLDGVTACLRPGGVLMVLLFEGDGEGPRTADIAKFGTARYFAYYRQDELGALAATHLTDVETYRLDISPRPTVVAVGRVPGPTGTGTGTT